MQFDQAYWSPLEIALGADMAGWFMWMHEVRLEDGTRVDAYKHRATRQYLHLAGDGQAMAYGADDTYRAVGLAPAIVRASSAGSVRPLLHITSEPSGRPLPRHAG